jgi:hypothetical protein
VSSAGFGILSTDLGGVEWMDSCSCKGRFDVFSCKCNKFCFCVESILQKLSISFKEPEFKLQIGSL